MHTPDLYKFKSSLKQIEDPLEKLDYVIAVSYTHLRAHET